MTEDIEDQEVLQKEDVGSDDTFNSPFFAENLKLCSDLADKLHVSNVEFDNVQDYQATYILPSALFTAARGEGVYPNLAYSAATSFGMEIRNLLSRVVPLFKSNKVQQGLNIMMKGVSTAIKTLLPNEGSKIHDNCLSSVMGSFAELILPQILTIKRQIAGKGEFDPTIISGLTNTNNPNSLSAQADYTYLNAVNAVRDVFGNNPPSNVSNLTGLPQGSFSGDATEFFWLLENATRPSTEPIRTALDDHKNVPKVSLPPAVAANTFFSFGDQPDPANATYIAPRNSILDPYIQTTKGVELPEEVSRAFYKWVTAPDYKAPRLYENLKQLVERWVKINGRPFDYHALRTHIPLSTDKGYILRGIIDVEDAVYKAGQVPVSDAERDSIRNFVLQQWKDHVPFTEFRKSIAKYIQVRGQLTERLQEAVLDKILDAIDTPNKSYVRQWLAAHMSTERRHSLMNGNKANERIVKKLNGFSVPDTIIDRALDEWFSSSSNSEGVSKMINSSPPRLSWKQIENNIPILKTWVDEVLSYDDKKSTAGSLAELAWREAEGVEPMRKAILQFFATYNGVTTDEIDKEIYDNNRELFEELLKGAQKYGPKNDLGIKIRDNLSKLVKSAGYAASIAKIPETEAYRFSPERIQDMIGMTYYSTLSDVDKLYFQQRHPAMFARAQTLTAQQMFGITNSQASLLNSVFTMWYGLPAGWKKIIGSITAVIGVGVYLWWRIWGSKSKKNKIIQTAADAGIDGLANLYSLMKQSAVEVPFFPAPVTKALNGAINMVKEPLKAAVTASGLPAPAKAVLNKLITQMKVPSPDVKQFVAERKKIASETGKRTAKAEVDILRMGKQEEQEQKAREKKNEADLLKLMQLMETRDQRERQFQHQVALAREKTEKKYHRTAKELDRLVSVRAPQQKVDMRKLGKKYKQVEALKKMFTGPRQQKKKQNGTSSSKTRK